MARKHEAHAKLSSAPEISLHLRKKKKIGDTFHLHFSPLIEELISDGGTRG